jgi:hypothetical protein
MNTNENEDASKNILNKEITKLRMKNLPLLFFMSLIEPRRETDDTAMTSRNSTAYSRKEHAPMSLPIKR